MSINPTSPLTGSAQTGFTSPTYTLAADTAPTSNGKQVAVVGLGGTQAGVTVHSVSSPFTLLYERPKVLRSLGSPSLNGFIANVPRNNHKVVVRKGVTPAANQPATPMFIRVNLEVPAGADTYDAANVRAAISATIGYLQQISAGIGDTVITGIM